MSERRGYVKRLAPRLGETRLREETRLRSRNLPTGLFGPFVKHTLKARYVLPIDGPPVPDGVVALEGNRIIAVGGQVEGALHDLGNVALLPALINAHTHLEFSALEAPLGAAGQVFPEWILDVVTYRRGQLQQADSEKRRADAFERGLAESLAGGCLTVAEVASPPWDAWQRIEPGPVEPTLFLELIGLSEQRGRSVLAQATRVLDELRERSALRVGISPHAPYTVHPEVVQDAVRFAHERNLPLAMHLAETMPELELLASGSGPLVELLQELEAWDPSAIPRGIRPLDYLKWLAGAPRSLIVHGNYLTRAELEFVAAQEQMTVVYCPRTHAYFGHARYALEEMLELGVHVALGTDSRASNPDLDMLSELRFAAARHPAVPASRMLEMATKDAAAAIGFEDRGVLRSGCRADLIAVPLPDRDGDPHELLLDSDEPATALRHVGGWSWDAGGEAATS